MSVNPWDAAVIAAKAASAAATLGAAGAVFFLRYCRALLFAAERSSIRRLVLCLATAAVLAGAVQIMLTAGSMSGEVRGLVDAPLLSMVLQGGEGRAALLRACGLALAACGLWSNRRLPGASVVGAALAAVSFAWVGHPRSLSSPLLPALLLCVHLLAVAFWLGALAPLLIVSRGGDVAHTAAAAVRFSTRAGYVVGVLMAAGAILLWMLLGGVAQLWSSSYGREVMFKLAVVACLLGFAAFNKLRLTPRMVAGDAAAERGFRASLRAEMLLGALILVITAAFTTLTAPPALG